MPIFCRLTIRCKLQSVLLLLTFVLFLLSGTTQASTIEVLRIAVAANFKSTLQQIIDQFSASTAEYSRDNFKISSGATGSLYTQIINGAPYDLFFAADQDSPLSLIEKGIASPSDQPVYAVGTLTLVSKILPSTDSLADCRQNTNRNDINTVLNSLLQNNNRIVIANPRTAPYGRAAMQWLDALSLQFPQHQPLRLVQARNIIHAQQLLEQTHADTAILSKAQSIKMKKQASVRYLYCDIPSQMHAPIAQAAVSIKSLKRTAANEALKNKLMEFIYSDTGKSIIMQHGYSAYQR